MGRFDSQEKLAVFWLQQSASCLRNVPILSNHPFHLPVSRQVRKARLQQKMNQAAEPVETLFTAPDGILRNCSFSDFWIRGGSSPSPCCFQIDFIPTQLIMPFLEGSEGEQFLPGKCGEGNAMGWNGLGWAGNGRKWTGSAHIESRAMVNHILIGWNHNTSWFLVWLKYLQIYGFPCAAISRRSNSCFCINCLFCCQSVYVPMHWDILD